MTPAATIAAISASCASAGRSPARTANSRPPMKRAVGTGRPSTSTLISMSASGSSRPLPPTAIRIAQVPVDTTVNGSLRWARWGTREAFESCAPQTTRTSGKARSPRRLGLQRPQRLPGVAHRRKKARPAEPRRPCSTSGPPSGATDRNARRSKSPRRPSTPLSRQDQYCGQARKARRIGEFRREPALDIEDLPPEIEPARKFGRHVSPNGGLSASYSASTAAKPSNS